MAAKKKFIQAMHMKKGALHKELHVPMGKKIPKEKLEEAAHHKGIEGKRARLAETLEGLHHGKKKSSVKKAEHKAGVKGDKKLHEMAEKRHEKKHDPKKPSKAKAKVEKVMHEFKEGKLHSGSKKGPEVTNPKQAIAIALSEARKVASKKNKKK